jgi:transcriptional regulator with PAS, ATPase and Fis domain
MTHYLDLNRAEMHCAENDRSNLCPDSIIGNSAELRRVKSLMTRIAISDCTVLITGETGTGKELAAEFIHEHSPRRNGRYVCINCAAIPEFLLESELFGHTKGAFTGAEHAQAGLLTAADGGTIFLDEVGDMSLTAQAKILRVIERKEVYCVGGTQPQQLDIRFVAATNHDLEYMTTNGQFRKDLFFRLNVVGIDLCPLRKRKEDIPLLLAHYTREFCRRTASPTPTFSEEFMKLLMQYSWPGNIREFKNMLEGMLANGVPQRVGPEHLPTRIIEAARTFGTERDAVIAALNLAKWNKTKAAENLHFSRNTLYRKMKRYRISQAVTQL